VQFVVNIRLIRAIRGQNNYPIRGQKFIQQHAKLIVDMRNMTKESSDKVYKL